VAVDQEKCSRAHVCVKQFACPTFVLHDDGSVTVHEDLCIGDGSCQQTCPVSAIVRPPLPEGRTPSSSEGRPQPPTGGRA